MTITTKIKQQTLERDKESEISNLTRKFLKIIWYFNFCFYTILPIWDLYYAKSSHFCFSWKDEGAEVERKNS